MRSVRVILAIIASVNAASIAAAPTPWKQSELNETYMRSLTRSECVSKTLETFERDCGDDPECLKTISGAFGDCIAWTPNDVGPMCTYLPTQTKPKCQAGALSPLQCKVLDALAIGYCRGKLPEVDSSTEMSAKQLFHYVAPSIVVVRALDPHGDVMTQGSGVVILNEIVASNCHVLRAALRPLIRYQDKDYPATVQHADIARDVCTLRVVKLPAPAIAADPKTLQSIDVGDKVYAVGAPRGLELTLSDGLISGFRDEPQGRYIQTSAPISPGSSGGGLFDAKGRLVGLTTLYLKDSQQLNFAVPVNWLEELPRRSTEPDNLKAQQQYAGEALKRLEAVLSKEDPQYACKAKLAMPATKAIKDKVHPLMLAQTFHSIYKTVDTSSCH